MPVIRRAFLTNGGYLVRSTRTAKGRMCLRELWQNWREIQSHNYCILLMLCDWRAWEGLSEGVWAGYANHEDDGAGAESRQARNSTGRALIAAAEMLVPISPAEPLRVGEQKSPICNLYVRAKAGGLILRQRQRRFQLVDSDGWEASRPPRSAVPSP
ncbi:hypothetical protein K458DRAFT_408442 [Lentithecium fluviatile CBS 122367]|uniref:Uncharacterized protein n=1 Tax=Lentithecium fluviatile CBS 122367 TaxID=1168545 RepID=A0A6G1IM46_9PLEO|nr:hypothetical protein K458DRAFT_408442 [Lentithecium fluviatile CBS 122367]